MSGGLTSWQPRCPVFIPLSLFLKGRGRKVDDPRLAYKRKKGRGNAQVVELVLLYLTQMS